MVFVKDLCGIICLLFTYLSIFYADYVVTKWIILTTFKDSLWGPVNVVLFNTIVFLLIMAHLKAVFLDPGSIPLPTSRLDFSDLHADKMKHDNFEWTVCTRCETFRPPRAHHCRICKRCIRRMDHHCPWVNNCVGERNQKFFLQFIFYVGILAIYSIILIIMTWLSNTDDDITLADAQTRMLHSVVLLLESGLFGLFVIAIGVDQIHAIFYDETAIEQLQAKGSYRPNTSKYELMSEVCGSRIPIYCWLLPCSGLNNRRQSDYSLLNHDV